MHTRYFEGNTANELYLQIIKELTANPQYITAPRGMQIKETLGAVVRLNDASQSLNTLVARKNNYAFGIIEKFEYALGISHPDRLIAYNKNYASHANEYGLYDGSYAERTGYWLKHIVNLIKSDKDTRQAVISIYGIQDRHKTKDVPCTLSLQFFVRDNKLNLIATMRSNDVLWGVPYDTNAFCFLQEVIASATGYEMGYYELHAGSLHIYTEREDQLLKLLDDQSELDVVQPRIPLGLTLEEIQEGIQDFFKFERAWRNMDGAEFPKTQWVHDYCQLLISYEQKKFQPKLPF